MSNSDTGVARLSMRVSGDAHVKLEVYCQHPELCRRVAVSDVELKISDQKSVTM